MSTESTVAPRQSSSGLDTQREHTEVRAIREELEACHGSQTRAAARLGISCRTLVERLDRYNLPRPRKD
jgi:DNA-binding NtrC family response regulator